MEHTLKPCPFCGGKAEIKTDEHPHKPNNSFYCVQCFGDCGDGDLWFNTKEEAVKHWNHRPIEDKLAEQIAEYERCKADCMPAELRIENAQLQAENARLKEALKQIAKDRSEPAIHKKTAMEQSEAWQMAWDKVTRKAEQALAAQPQKGDSDE